jgi:hypothetical protein
VSDKPVNALAQGYGDFFPGRTARRFLMERQMKECPVGFDVVATEELPGQAPLD